MANVAGITINNSAFIIIWVFFAKLVDIINGWTAKDVAGLMGFGTLSCGIVFSAGAGIAKLADYVTSEGPDRFMLSPKNLLARVAASAFNASKTHRDDRQRPWVRDLGHSRHPPPRAQNQPVGKHART